MGLDYLHNHPLAIIISYFIKMSRKNKWKNVSYKNSIIAGVTRNKVMAYMMPYLKIHLIIGDFIFAMSAYFSIILF